MSQQAVNRKIFIDDYVDPTTVDVIDWSPVLQIAAADRLGRRPVSRAARQSILRSSVL